MTEAAKNIRCRFAPSPTGDLHVGGARTALFNYLFARAGGGRFVLRIEDTDLERSTEESVKAIFDGLEWLRISWDEGPFFQTKRFGLYAEYAKRLLASGHAYACTCTAAELDAQREAQKAANQKPQYNRLHRPQALEAQPERLPQSGDDVPFVIRLRAPESGVCVFNDLILGEVSTSYSEIDDFIIVRSDGSPTYNFTVVVDDIDMQISHVIRGMDHVSNTPKQIAIYEALAAPTPAFAHVPMILGPDKKKLSKRHGATSVVEYKKDGFLPDAFVNYLARLGWSHGDQEIFTREELERVFALEAIGKSAAVFDLTKLSWVNAEHLKTVPMSELAHEVAEQLSFMGYPIGEEEKSPKFAKLLDSLRERAKTTKEMAEGCLWYLREESEFTIDSTAAAKHLTAEIKPALTALRAQLAALEEFSEQTTQAALEGLLPQFDLKLGKLAQPLRVAVTGTAVSPPIFTVLELLGKERALARLDLALKG